MAFAKSGDAKEGSDLEMKRRTTNIKTGGDII